MTIIDNRRQLVIWKCAQRTSIVKSGHPASTNTWKSEMCGVSTTIVHCTPAQQNPYCQCSQSNQTQQKHTQTLQ